MSPPNRSRSSRTPPATRSGFVVLVGRPSVGKSSLVNALVGQKVTIVSPRPQTTRRRILGIVTRPGVQLILVDTPGLHQPRHRLGERLIESTRRAIAGADQAWWVVDLSRPPSSDDRLALSLLREKALPVRLVANKSDRVAPRQQTRALTPYQALGSFTDVSIVSAQTGNGLDDLLALTLAQLPPGELLYPEDEITDQTLRQIAAELIREQVLLQTRHEVPHATAVYLDEWIERSDQLTYIAATIYVERDSQKGILIGAGGQMLKAIGQAARRQIEMITDTQVYLELRVKCHQDWRRNENLLDELEYGV